ncbi:hypothetical protein EDB83DRAFT_2373000 [Lactarius deliciosus]|nr:hypothetical protein EDB83DRAFT_2373000 [Lactarius deliciosus]
MPQNPRIGELSSSASFPGLLLVLMPSTGGAIIPSPAYSPTPVSVLTPALPTTRRRASRSTLCRRDSETQSQSSGLVSGSCERAPRYAVVNAVVLG